MAFCRFVFGFSKRKMKRQVSCLLFWFENEVVDVVLSNRFQKSKQNENFLLYQKTNQNETTIKKSKRAKLFACILAAAAWSNSYWNSDQTCIFLCKVRVYDLQHCSHH